MIVKVLALWGIADGIWAMIAPLSWQRFWRRILRAVGQRPAAIRLVAGVELAISLYLLARSRQGAGSGARWRLPRPSGLLKQLARLPILAYRAGRGGIFGHRGMLLTHRGRRTGQLHQTVIEVIRYDPATRESIVVSGWGETTDWYRNIQVDPAVEVATGRQRYRPAQRFLTPEEAYAELTDYRRRHPVLGRVFAWLLDIPLDAGTEQAVATKLRMVAFRPADG